ncbi:hypothetical protein BAUCODRAFT_78428 [Baudoinia panamericana UAMH 10762]|uniref:Peptidase A1 domain-containing protein n=1 Tax=Baudoinia panamericana (strain UAMH 10762) TaxID=717646 RepID=M2N0N1_BAUPA|nr:uncharacterized protein BAUCODRAFT_78428 [Baudoinia panamericana UAMH 10762]EMC92474.1 hypothetical protein BAUCODRAFT_78428 [Baudoinia panamericana UAMH 10762]
MPSLLRHLLLLPSALLALTVSRTLGELVEVQRRQSTTLPSPIAFAPDQNWDGIDGSWSTFTLRIGTPAQYVRTFVSFAAYQTWAVLPQGCQSASDYNGCMSARGGVYNQSASSTFENIGIYDLWIEENLGLIGNAIFGYDAVGLGGNGENGPTLKNTTVGGLAVPTFYLGVFGVNPKPTNWTSFNDPAPSYMTQLKEEKLIASVSASYTAGAPYRFSGVLASLTLGGYDSSKFVSNSVPFTFAADNSRDLVVAIQSISTPSSNGSNPVGTALLPGPIYAYIDSTVSQIWLPMEACQVFESVFGLVYDNTTQLYLVNDTLHSSLLQRNANVTFQLAQAYTGGPSVQITLPYAAFDLTASPPYQGLTTQTRYFPLRRAANSSQYTLGRTFLQEAYLTVDWEAQQFNVSQVLWDSNAKENLVVIPPTSQSSSSSASSSYPGTDTSSTSSNKLSAGAIAGIVIGAVAAVVLLALLLIWFFRKRSKDAQERERQNEKLGSNSDESNERGRQANVFPKAELEGSAPTPPTPIGVQDNRRLLSTAGGSISDAPASNERQIHEMPGDMPTVREKDGRALSEKEALAHREKVYNGVDSAPNSQTAINEDGSRERRRVDPSDVVRMPTSATTGTHASGGETRDQFHHRAFSFEQERGNDDLGLSFDKDRDSEYSQDDLYS